MIMQERSYRLYLDVYSRMIKKAPSFSMGGIDSSKILQHLEVRTKKPTGIIAKIGNICIGSNLSDESLHFSCDTFSKLPWNYHILKVIDIKGKRSIPIVERKLFMNREVAVFSKLIHAFIQGLCNYAFKLFSAESLARRYGVPVRVMPLGFGWSVEDWEKQFNVPSLGTTDIIGSYMRHVFDGTLTLDGKPLVDL